MKGSTAERVVYAMVCTDCANWIITNLKVEIPALDERSEG